MEYLMLYWNLFAFPILGLVFGFAFPSGHPKSFIICLACYAAAQTLAIETL